MPVESQSALDGSPTEQIGEKQRAISAEIVSVEYAFGEALANANKTDGASFASEVDRLSARLEKASKKLDSLGPFSASLRTATLKGIDGSEAKIAELMRGRSWRAMQSDTQKSNEKAGERYFVAWGEICEKAGLDEDASAKSK